MIWITIYLLCAVATWMGIYRLAQIGIIPFDQKLFFVIIVWPVIWLAAIWLYLGALLEQKKEENKILKDVQKTLDRIKFNIDKKKDNV